MPESDAQISNTDMRLPFLFVCMFVWNSIGISYVTMPLRRVAVPLSGFNGYLHCYLTKSARPLSVVNERKYTPAPWLTAVSPSLAMQLLYVCSVTAATSATGQMAQHFKAAINLTKRATAIISIVSSDETGAQTIWVKAAEKAEQLLYRRSAQELH